MGSRNVELKNAVFEIIDITGKIYGASDVLANDTAKSLIEELKQRYPRKPALLDELEKVEKKL